MEDQLQNLIYIFSFFCYIFLSVAEKEQDMSCRVSPFMDKSYDPFIEDENVDINGICTQESEKYSREMSISDKIDHSSPWAVDDLTTSQEKSTIDKRNSNKSKAAAHSKMELKKASNTKKLKGSKKQRKKEKKKKSGKKKKKS